jgi:hypothetical protein
VNVAAARATVVRQSDTDCSGSWRIRPESERVSHQLRFRSTKRALGVKAEGEGFEPSIRSTGSTTRPRKSASRRRSSTGAAALAGASSAPSRRLHGGRIS